MRKTLILLTLMTLTSTAFAERFRDTVHSVSEGTQGEDHLVYMKNGRVFFVDDKDSIDTRHFVPGEHIEVEVDDTNTMVSVTSLPDESIPNEEEPNVSPITTDTSVISNQQASSIFSGMNRSWKSDTECTDRAQVWAYEEWKKNNLHSRKVFLFFTNTYIRAYRYHWWFHVSPYVLVDEGSSTSEKVMDRRYTSGPRYMKTWTDIFIRSKKTCTSQTYAHYRANKNGPEHCFLVKSDMYYRLPYHVRMLEDYGQVKTKFSISEVNFSYRAFTRRGAK